MPRNLWMYNPLGSRKSRCFHMPPHDEISHPTSRSKSPLTETKAPSHLPGKDKHLAHGNQTVFQTLRFPAKLWKTELKQWPTQLILAEGHDRGKVLNPRQPGSKEKEKPETKMHPSRSQLATHFSWFKSELSLQRLTTRDGASCKYDAPIPPPLTIMLIWILGIWEVWPVQFVGASILRKRSAAGNNSSGISDQTVA